MRERARLGLRLPVHINQQLETEAGKQYVSKNTLAIQIFEKWLKDRESGRDPSDRMSKD